jgi:hypothetical protein
MLLNVRGCDDTDTDNVGYVDDVDNVDTDTDDVDDVDYDFGAPPTRRL